MVRGGCDLAGNRGCGWALIGLAVAPLLVPAALGGRTAGLDQAAVVLMCLLAICACGLLAVTSQGSPLTATTVALATGGGVVTGLSIFALMPFERAGAALAGRVPADLGWAGVGVVAVVGTYRCADQGRTGRPRSEWIRVVAPGLGWPR